MVRCEEVDEIVDIYTVPVELTAAAAEMKRLCDELGPCFCHRCAYCLPCDQGVQIPYVLVFPTMLKRFGTQTALAINEKVLEWAEGCTARGACLERCPYDLLIPDLIQDESLVRYREATGRRS